MTTAITGFRVPTRTFIGRGASSALPTIVPSGRVLLLTDAGLSATPHAGRIHDVLSRAGCEVLVEGDVAPNPRADWIDAVAARHRTSDVSTVVGLGGGSVLDAAKAVAMLLRNPGSCRDYEGKNRFSGGSVPFLAIPTTCGTGSEVTWVSVISDTKARTKISVKGDDMFPAWALVDADFLDTLPASLVASTGMDAITHAVEAYIGRAANPVSDALALQATALLASTLEGAVGGDPAALETVMRGSTIAGMAFGNADVGGVHCLSEAIGGRHDLPHGLLNAVLLIPVLRYHGAAAADRLADLDRAIGGEGDDLLGRLGALADAVGIPGFDALDVPKDDFDEIARAAEANGSNASNPRPMTASDYGAILASL